MNLTTEAFTRLEEGVNLVLCRWTALRMAVENEWGGRDSRQKAQQLGADILSWFKHSKEALYIDELEVMLEDSMLSLNTEVDDGSIEEIAEKLMIMHEECLEGNFKAIEKLLEAGPPVAIPYFKQASNEDDSDSDSDDSTTPEQEASAEMAVDAPETKSVLNQTDMMVDEPSSMKAVDPDGWTTVSSRRNRGRRN